MKAANALIALTLCAVMLLCCGCVDQKPADAAAPAAEGGTIAATSVAIMEICRRLDLDLVGVPKTDLVEIPECYHSATVVGNPMAPDMEILAQLHPDWVLSPNSLQSDLQPKYEAAGLRYGFLNLRTVFGLYKSIEDLGALFGRQAQAEQMQAEFDAFLSDYRETHQDKPKPTVLLLMGLPGSYVVATEHSYAGSLLELAGAENVYAGTDKEFLNVNTEDMLRKNPDIILRTAHAMPESVMEMFGEEFRTNDIWKHFSAVQNGQVYDLPHEYFGMSANFTHAEALEYLDGILFREDLVTGGGK